MARYLIAWTEEVWYNLIVDTPSEYAALAMFHNGEFDREECMWVGSEIQDSIEVEAI